MITKFYSSGRPRAFAYQYPQQQQSHYPRPSPADKQRADLLKITPEEFLRRDKIVCGLWLSKPYFKGDVTLPVDAKHKTKYGTITIMDVFQSYHAFPLKEAMEWPDDDMPYTITAASEHEEGLILLHPSWLENKTPVKKGAECPTC